MDDALGVCQGQSRGDLLPEVEHLIDGKWTALCQQGLQCLTFVVRHRDEDPVGDVSIATDGANTVIYASDKSIINYSNFDILVNESVRFIQPGSAARVLNRVRSELPTHIRGSLTANGQVYIVNPAGIFFGGSAVVDTAGLTAAAGHMTNSDFLNNIDHFTGITGNITNAGTIEALVVNLIGSRVQNLGSIVAPDGMITMVAGSDVYLTTVDGKIMVQVEGGIEGDEAGVD